ncbi:hypothetical protein M8494_09825 [Serratia ureilytica]
MAGGKVSASRTGLFARPRRMNAGGVAYTSGASRPALRWPRRRRLINPALKAAVENHRTDAVRPPRRGAWKNWLGRTMRRRSPFK